MRIHVKKWIMMYSNGIINERKAPISLKSDGFFISGLGETHTETEARLSQRERNRS